MYSKFSFEEVYHRIYGLKNYFNGDARTKPLNVISESIFDNIPLQRKILNMVIPILMRFWSLGSNWSIARRIKCDVIYDIELF